VFVESGPIRVLGVDNVLDGELVDGRAVRPWLTTSSGPVDGAADRR
jgi:hypothetical protein